MVTNNTIEDAFQCGSIEPSMLVGVTIEGHFVSVDHHCM